MGLNFFTATDSSTFDKFTKIVTLLFISIGIALSIIMSLYHSNIKLNSNYQAYNDQIGLMGYISKNIMSNPIKNVYFRDLYCDNAEETSKLFPWKNATTLNYWQSQVICLERYKTMNYTNGQNACGVKQQKCGIYCIPSSEGTSCPITKILIQPTNQTAENATQTLHQGRGLYIYRVTSSTDQGMYRLEVDIDTFPCMNDNDRNLGGLNMYLGITTSQICDYNGFDSLNSIRVEQMAFKTFLVDNTIKINSNYPAGTTKDSSQAQLTTRQQIKYQHTFTQCGQILYTKINDIQTFAYDIEEIGLVYLYINSILTCFLLIIFLVELILLRGKIHKDLKVITVLFKILTIIQLTFVLIEGTYFQQYQGGLVLNQISQKQLIDVYFTNLDSNGCFPQQTVSNFFKNFPDLFSTDLTIFIQLFLYTVYIIGILEAILIILYIIQMIKWCISRSHNIKLKPKEYPELEFSKIRPNIMFSKDSDRLQTIIVLQTESQGQEQTVLKINKKSQKY